MHPAGDVHECVAVHIDDLAFVMKDPEAFAKVLVDKHRFKSKGTGPLTFHLVQISPMMWMVPCASLPLSAKLRS